MASPSTAPTHSHHGPAGTTASAHGHAADPGHGHGFAHPMPVWKLFAVFVALVGLTVLTVASSMLPLGPLEMWVSMGIATVKAILVAVFFMHLIHDRPFNILIFVGTFVFVALFVLMLLLDAREYLPQVEAYLLDPTNN